MALVAKELLSLPEMFAAYDVLSFMYPDLKREEFEAIVASRAKEGYRMAAVYEGDSCLGAAGFWIGTRFYCGRFIQLDNMVVHPEKRSSGAGKALVDFVKDIGRKAGCNRMILDSYVENFDAHRFFYREGFIIRGYHFNAPL